MKAIVISGAAALLALLQFGTLGMALLTGGALLAIHTVSGNLLTPWLTGRASCMSPVVIFVGVLAWGWLWNRGDRAAAGCGYIFLGVLAWGWLWGIWGLRLGAPLIIGLEGGVRPIG